MPDSPVSFSLRTPSDVLGMIPYLLGFHPEDSLVVVLIGTDRQLLGTMRIDLAAPPSVAVERLKPVLDRHAGISVVVVGYGPLTAMGLTRTAAEVIAQTVPALGVHFVSVGHRFCLTPGCGCPAADGVLFDARDTAVAAQSTVAGLVALPSRDALIALAEPDPAAQAAVAAAIRDLPEIRPSKAVLRDMLDQAALDVRLSDEQVARLVVMLRDQRVREAVWLAATSDRVWQRDLWLDITRRVPDDHAAAPAFLAAWCAWLRGEDPLAHEAARRALAADPGAQMPKVIIASIQTGMPARDLIGVWPPATTGTTPVVPA
ncbi:MULTISPECIES: DUF4192 domain-containing protein [Catenuloplanes]|uniref:DUF4192 domain-containing protein n=1 Tax=Catenuloplanes niger TaxID=587534 RepID=A0AAE4CRA3_9ACTN|nr:DUF4192 domain-containing protein [Catenuloplanes niger]MDR7322646.1 hypothetical protein [Catenuloplanes niger]